MSVFARFGFNIFLLNIKISFLTIIPVFIKISYKNRKSSIIKIKEKKMENNTNYKISSKKYDDITTVTLEKKSYTLEVDYKEEQIVETRIENQKITPKFLYRFLKEDYKIIENYLQLPPIKRKPINLFEFIFLSITGQILLYYVTGLFTKIPLICILSIVATIILTIDKLSSLHSENKQSDENTIDGDMTFENINYDNLFMIDTSYDDLIKNPLTEQLGYNLRIAKNRGLIDENHYINTEYIKELKELLKDIEKSDKKAKQLIYENIELINKKVLNIIKSDEYQKQKLIYDKANTLNKI